jgi:hypothetical protein
MRSMQRTLKDFCDIQVWVGYSERCPCTLHGEGRVYECSIHVLVTAMRRIMIAWVLCSFGSASDSSATNKEKSLAFESVNCHCAECLQLSMGVCLQEGDWRCLCFVHVTSRLALLNKEFNTFSITQRVVSTM